MKKKLENFKKVETTQVDEQQNKIDEIIQLLRQLYLQRFVQKISRPYSYLQKQKIYVQFKQKFVLVHQLIQQIQKQYIYQLKRQKNPSIKPSKLNINMNTNYHKLDIMKITQKYNQVFIQGSFKFYYRVAKVFGLPTDLQVLNIEQWSNQCLKDQAQQKCC